MVSKKPVKPEEISSEKTDQIREEKAEVEKPAPNSKKAKKKKKNR